MSDAKEMPDRDPLAAAMFAAWVKVPVDKVPPEFKQFNCPATMEAWLRVGRAAQAYFRSEAAIAAARAEGERIGMERATMPNREMIAFVLWKAEADRAAPNVGRTRTLAGFFDESEYTRTKWLSLADAVRAAMDAKPPPPEYPSDADIDRSLSTARLLPDFLKPVDRP